MTIEARKAGDSSWTNLETDSIDLSAFAGTRQNFELRMTAAEVSSAQSRTFNLNVSV